jgi:SsrA-binding protein
MGVRMEYSQHRHTFIIGTASGTQQYTAVNLVALRRLSDIVTRHHVSDDALRGAQQQSAALIGQRSDARGHHGVTLSHRECKHPATLTTGQRLREPDQYAGDVARAKQIQERRAKSKAEAVPGDRVVASNRRARHDYEIIDTLECGIVLSGSEVKSLREGKAQIVDSYARIDDGELWLFQMHIPPWSYAVGYGSHEPDRKRKLLVHRHEIDRLHHKIRMEPLTLVPLRVYFKDGRAKVEVALAKGRQMQDRREALKKRDAEREIARSVRNNEKFS